MRFQSIRARLMYGRQSRFRFQLTAWEYERSNKNLLWFISGRNETISIKNAPTEKLQCEESDGDFSWLRYQCRGTRARTHWSSRTIMSWFIDKFKLDNNNNTRRHPLSVSESIKYVIRYFLALLTRICSTFKNIIADVFGWFYELEFA